jgi:predicted HTH domain antitoxin
LQDSPSRFCISAGKISGNSETQAGRRFSDASLCHGQLFGDGHCRHFQLFHQRKSPLSRLAKKPVQVHALPMQLTLPANVETTLSPRKAALHLAIGLFVSEEVTLGQASEIAGLTQAAFLKELGARRISIHYGLEELAEDLKMVESFRS